MTNMLYVCPKCESQDIELNAAVSFDINTQCMEVKRWDCKGVSCCECGYIGSEHEFMKESS